MSMIGNIEPFNGVAEEFETYLERMEHLFAVNKVEDELKVSMFITLAGTGVYQILKNLAAPRKPGELTYKDIVDLLKSHYAPPVSEIYERFVFNRCNQKPDQSVSEYIVELRKLASSCNFKTFLDDALRDRFVCGLRSENIQRKLLADFQLTFQSACQTAQASEVAEKQVKGLSDDSSRVNYLKGQNSKAQNKSNTKSSSFGDHNLYNGNRCEKCGRVHSKDKCPAKRWKCFNCQMFGHVRDLCPSKSKLGLVQETEDSDTTVNFVQYDENVNTDLYNLNQVCVGNSSSTPHYIMLKVNNQLLQFEVDTGACKTVVSKKKFMEMLNLPLKQVYFRLNTVSGQTIKALGECVVTVDNNNKKNRLVITVIESEKDFVPLLGRNWLNVLFPDWQNNFSIKSLSVSEKSKLVDGLRKKYQHVFDKNLCNPIQDFEVKFSIKNDVVPIVKKAYDMPYALKPKVENKLEQMVKVGILKPVNFSEWASPIVVVPKKDGDVRICTDFRVTVNKVVNVDQYPLPKPEDIFASLAGGKVFTVLDLSGAYQQLKVHPDFQKYLTINTHVGLYQFTRLTYGISCAPSIFQSVMDQILCGLPNVNCYLDDILIAGKTLQDAQEKVDLVLQRLNSYNVKVNSEKCKFFESQVEYLGHRIDSEGIHPTQEKLRAINDAPEPKNITQLRAYLGLINYYSRFLPMLSSKLRPLYDLLEKDKDFDFDESCRKAFVSSKELIANKQVLAHYDPQKTIIISCDSSSGVGGVLSHRENGVERPVCFASSSLSKAEKNYSQLEREALAIIFSVKKFHKYIFGRPFILVSDHQPLRIIFNPDKNISVMSASRIIRWSVILSAYNYQIEYRKGSQLFEADMLSRLPLSDSTDIDSSINSFNCTDELPICYEDIAKVSSKDPVLMKVIHFVKTGWPDKVDSNLKPYFSKRNELSIEENCLMKGIKVVVPEALQKYILDLLHEDHIGIVRSKMLARSVVWWPNLQQDIELLVNSCHICQLNQRNHEKYLISWPKTENVFSRVHIDFFKKYDTYFLLIVDSKSRWPDLHVMTKGTNATQTIEKLKSTFSVMGLPDMIVSDNGPPFNSVELEKFCQVNGIKLLKAPPYHPQSNGSAERHVDTVKTAFDKYLSQKSTLTVEQMVVNFLFSYRTTPTSSGLSPNEMIFKVKPKTKLDLLLPRKGGNIYSKNSFDIVKAPIFSVGEKVLVGKLGPYCYDKWKPGEIVKCVSGLTYLVKVDDKIMYKHVNSIRKFPSLEQPNVITESQIVQSDSTSVLPHMSPPPVKINSPTIKNPVSVQENISDVLNSPSNMPKDNMCIPSSTQVQVPEASILRRSARVRQAPQKLNL